MIFFCNDENLCTITERLADAEDASTSELNGETRGRRNGRLNEGTSDQDATNELRNNYLLLPDCRIEPSRLVCPMKIAR